MSHREDEAAIAAFIRKQGVTRCPTACAIATQGAVSLADRQQLRERAAELDARREARRAEQHRRLFGSAAAASA